MYQGKSAIAICFDDILSLSVPLSDIRHVVRWQKLGITNIAKDFVPTNSTNAIIRRGSNSMSKKCTVIRTSTIPSELKDRLLTGK